LYNTFALAYSFDQDISGWYTDAVNEMVGTFSSAKSFNRDISEWHTGAVTSLQEMFSFSSSFNVDISGWDTTSVTSYESMFKYTYDFSQVLCWNIGGGITTDMFYSSSGSSNRYAAKCACTAGEFYNGSSCQTCPPGLGSNGKTESCFAITTPPPTLFSLHVPSMEPSFSPTQSIVPSTEPSVVPFSAPSTLLPTLVLVTKLSAVPTSAHVPTPSLTLAPTQKPLTESIVLLPPTPNPTVSLHYPSFS